MLQAKQEERPARLQAAVVVKVLLGSADLSTRQVLCFVADMCRTYPTTDCSLQTEVLELSNFSIRPSDTCSET